MPARLGTLCSSVERVLQCGAGALAREKPVFL